MSESENDWHGYFLAERHKLGLNNWAALLNLLENMGTRFSPYPAHNKHWRARPDGDAVIYESRFSRAEVTMPAFKQLLSTELQVPAEGIAHAASYTSYGGDEETVIYTFAYLGVDRFSIHRFGSSGTWLQSRHEARAYLATYAEDWEEKG
jgi:hypothetical protein